MTPDSQHEKPPRGVYGLEEPAVPRPDLPGEVIAAANVDELIDHLAADLVVHAENCVREFGDFHLALSGGAVFEALYARLMYDPNYRRLPWRRTHLWLVEERCVPFDHEASCYRMINELIGDHADIPAEQFHPIFAQSDAADREYQEAVRETLGWREKGQDRLDYVLLAMDDHGATAGIVAAHDTTEDLVAVESAGDGGPRIALTYPFINAARFVAVLVSGQDRADVVQRLAAGGGEADRLPARSLSPINGELKWYVDGPACGVDCR
ncbi:MAG: 6-phosphogluconolactonase [Planctomycetes bacterium]|nr:6-phosphogluconolactonase [Planctomycetota bacterium]